MNQAKLLIAGATGTNGRELLKQLSKHGIKARALVRDAAKAAGHASETVELVQGDLADPASLETAFEGIDKAYIVTAIHKDTVRGFKNFFEAAEAASVIHLVKFSAYGADVNSASEVLRQHGHSDKALIKCGIPYTILRPNAFYQNMLWQAGSIRSTGQFFLPVGDARVSKGDVRDVAEATVRILSEEGHENKAYDLTGPESISYYDVAYTLSQALKKPVTYVPVTVDAARTFMLDSGMPEWDANVVAEIQGVFATGIYAPVTDDLEQLLGHRPRTFTEFARDHVQVFGA